VAERDIVSCWLKNVDDVKRKTMQLPLLLPWDTGLGCEWNMMLIFLLIFLGPKFRNKIRSNGAPTG
jgi:hypothetical protein